MENQTFNYKGEILNVKDANKKLRLKKKVIETAINKDALNKMIINKETGKISYVNYGNSPQLIKESIPENFKQVLNKNIIFSDKIELIKTGRGGRNNFIVARHNQSIKSFDDLQLQFKIIKISWSLSFEISHSLETRHITIQLNKFMSKEGIINKIINETNKYLLTISAIYTNNRMYLTDDFKGDRERDLLIFETGYKEAQFPINIHDIVIQEEGRTEYRELLHNANKYYIRLEEPLKLDNLHFFNCDLFEYENPEKQNCLLNYLKNHFKQKSYYKGLKNKEDPTLQDLYDFIESNPYQEAYLFTLTGKLLYKKEGLRDANKKKFKNDVKNIYAIIHNNHIYGLKPKNNHNIIKYLKYNNDQFDNTVVIKNTNDFFKKINDIITIDKSEPKFINADSFIHKNIKYIQNNEYDDVELFYNKLGLNPNYKFNKMNVCDDLCKLYNINYSSYFPYEYKQSGFYFVSNNKYDMDDLITFDKNKCYPSCLAKLPFLITCDIKYNEPKIYNDDEIIEHYLYIIHSEISNIFTPDNYMIVSGRYINFIKLYNKSPFKITEVITTTKHENNYTDMLDNVFTKLNNKFVKMAFCIMIGKMQKTGYQTIQTRTNFKVVSNESFNFEESPYFYGIDYGTDCNHDYVLSYEIEEKTIDHKLSNNLPISYQILEEARMTIYNKLLELNVDENDIIQIKTDSITLKNKKKYIKKIKDEPKNFYGWKLEETKLLKNVSFPNTEKQTFFFNVGNGTCEVYNKLAGCGKTYDIINNKINSFNGDYCVLAFKHSTLEPYRLKSLNCNTIDHYIFRNIKPKEKHIIIDEFGLLKKEHLDFLLKLHYQHNKILYLYGDILQLEAPFNNNSGLITKNFLYHISKVYSEEWKNYRNKFTSKFYMKLINEYQNEDLVNYCLDKYTSDDLANVDMCIAYRHETIQQLQNEVLKAKNLIFDKENMKISKGVKVINKTNHLIINDIEFFNNQRFITEGEDEDNIILKDTLNIEYKIPKTIFYKNFDNGFVETLYSCQGSSYKSIYYDRRDKYFLMNMKNALYVLISRLKTKF